MLFLDMHDDVEFSRRLQEEESVMVLPGKCFRAPGMFRICFAAPVPILDAAFDRLHSFCARHANRECLTFNLSMFPE
jgi:tyrosine aminotransferase